MGQQPKAVDQEGTLRAELLGKMLAAQGSLQTQLAELRFSGGSPDLIAACDSQLASLLALQSGLASASPSALALMRAEVLATVATASTMTQQMRTAAAANPALMSAQLAAAGAATRRELASLSADLFERRIFDKYLIFASSEEEDAYRRREAEGRRYIDGQLALKTPEGDLNAAGGTVDRMLDAHAHGAGTSPDFQPRWNRLVETTQKHREALRQEARSTDEFDRNLSASVRRYLKSKGLSDAEIEARMAVMADPLEVVKPYLRTEQDAKVLGESVNRSSHSVLNTTVTTITVAQPSALEVAKLPPVTVEDAMASFRAAGVLVADAPTAEASARGVPVTARGVSPEGRPGGALRH